MGEQEKTSTDRSVKTAHRSSVYVSLADGESVETVVLIGTKHIDMTRVQAQHLYECLREVLGVTS